MSTGVIRIPEGRHDDWKIWPLKLIPRRWTAFGSLVPPIRILGTEREEDHLDIPEKGKWVIAGVGRIPIPVFFAITFQQSRTWYGRRWNHFRIGLLRYDYNGHYYTGPTLSAKQLGE